MKAAITDGRGKLWLEEISQPNLGPFDCLVRIECCAFCNSTDRHVVEGAAVLGVKYPAILGHESVGIVEHVGEKVRNFQVGDRVLRAYAAYPDEMLGQIASGWGGFAEYGKITDWQAMGMPAGALRYQQKVPAEIDAQLATLLIPQKEIYSAMPGIETIAGQQFLVAGAGIAGLLFGLSLRERGAARVAVVARRREALNQIVTMQAADEVWTFDELRDAPPGFDALVETTGSLNAISELLPTLRTGAPIYAYAVYPGGGKDPALLALCEQHPLQRLRPDEAAPHQIICDKVRSGQLDHRQLIKHVFPLDKLDEAWRTVLDKNTFKTIVHMF